jgi:hypothetical protein
MLRSSRTGPTKIGSLTRASAVIVGALVALFGVVAGPLLGVFATSSASAATTGSGYTAITPYRALGTSAAGTAVVAGTPATVQITSATAGEVPAGATAAVLNVTASAPTSAGYLELYPGTTAPATATSNVNFTAGETVANLVTVPLSATGGISVANFAGTTAVDVDVEGFYSAAGAGLYNPVSPVRVAGTAAAGTPVAANTAVPVTVTGGTIPTSATAVVVNLTAAGGTSASYLSAYAAGATPATTSSLNFTAGETVANRDVVNVGTGGAIDVYNFAGSVNVDVDVDGYYGATGGAFVPLAAPVRVTDTRAGTALNGTSIASGGTETFNLATTASTIPATASAVAANFTVVPGTAPGYITVFPTGVTTPPTASDVNWPASSGAVANFTQADTAGTTAGSAQVYNLNSGSPIDVVIDAFGYFTGITSGVAVTATPATITSNGTATSLVNAVVTNTGLPVSADPLAITATPSAAGVCSAASLSATTGVTNASGTLATPITYTATTTPGTCTIKFTEADHQLVGTTVVTSAPNNTVAITTPTGGSTTAPHLVAENGGTQNIVSTVTSSVGAGVVGDVINFTLTPNTSAPGPGCGTLAAPSETTGTGGVTPADAYSTPFNLGVCTITATEATAGTGETAPQTANTVIDSTIATPVANTLVLTRATATPAAGAADTVTATVLGPTSAPLANDPVLLTLTNSSGTSGVLNTTSGVTNASGVVTFTYTAPTTSGAVSITGVESSSGVAATAPITLTTTVAQNDAVAVTANPNSLTDNGTSTSAVSVTDTNNAGAPVVGTTINFTLTPSVTGACGTLSSTGGITNSSGSVTVTYTSSTATGFCTVTATEAAIVPPESAVQNGTTQITEHV